MANMNPGTRRQRGTPARCGGRVLAVAALVVGMNVQVAQAQDLQMPKVAFSQRVLPNGLRVIAAPDRSNPTVAVQVWYVVGSKDDPQGRSGFAHLFEHIMFKGTKHMAAEQFDRMTEDVGGVNNAATASDYTVYFETIPSNHLERLLWAEAERMSNLRVDAASFHSERAVVQEEYRQRVLSNPYGKLYNALVRHSYVAHPYRWPGIGSIEDLDAASLQDVAAFHRTYYRPDNAVLVVAGDFEQAQLDGWVDRYFGWIPRPAGAIPRVSVQEPVRTQHRRHVETSATAPTPALGLSWQIPASRHPDIPALEVADALLGRGESSRLYQRLVHRDQIAQQLSAGAGLQLDPGVFSAIAILNAGHQPADAERAILEEIDRLAGHGASDEELRKVKMQVLTSRLQSLQLAEGKAMMLGGAAVLDGDPAHANQRLEALQRVTSADVQRVVKAYLVEGKRVAIDYLPETKPDPKAAATGAQP